MQHIQKLIQNLLACNGEEGERGDEGFEINESELNFSSLMINSEVLRLLLLLKKVLI